MRSLRRPGLLLQIGLALAIVGVVPLAMTVWSLISVNREALVDQLLRTHTVSARTTADAIDSFLDARRSLAGSLLLEPEIASDPTSAAAQARLRDSLASWSDAGIVAAALYGDAGALLVKVQQRGYGDLADRLLAGGESEPARLQAIDGNPWLRLDLPLTNRRGTLRLAVDAATLLHTLAPEELGDQARLLLLDREGRPLLASADADAAVAALPAPLADAALVARLSGSGRYRDPSGREIVGAWSTADGGRWIVISTQPAAIAEAAAQRMARRSAIAVALALALVGALSLVAWRALVRPLRALLAAQRQVAGLQASPTAGSETAELRSAMVALERNARDREALDQVFLGRFQVVEIIGSGGMGTVFRGWDPRLQRPIALKTIHLERRGERTEDGSATGRLLAEAVAAAQINHPGVVAVYDAEAVADIAYIAMEYVHGTGLDRYIEARGKLSWREAVPLGQAIADGLAAAHARELVHRDIKPGNILLGQDGTIKIADFGLAQFLNQRSEKVGQIVGTPGFLAPEALLGKPYTAWSDLFALGVILSRSLTGDYPFRGRALRDIVAATVHEPAPAPDRYPPEVPKPVIEIVTGLLEKNPERRLGPAREVARRLGEIAQLHDLVWHLDFERSSRAIDADEIFRSIALPSRLS
ncbi:MAG: serine/threonine protein kinase [Thermoanaerobaculia bacterium]